MNTVNDNITFGAKLDYSRIKGSEARWSKIAEVFENKTKKYPNDTFVLETNDKGGIYFYPSYSNKTLQKTHSYDKGEVSWSDTNVLEIFSAERTADAFKRMFSIRRKADSMLIDYFNMEDKYDLTNDKKVNPEFLDDFYRAFFNLRENFVKQKIKEDKVLKTLDKIDII